MRQYRHGDVFLREIAELPTAARRTLVEGDVILAYGEVTGHAHRIATPGVAMWNASTQEYLTVETPAALTHEEHGTITLPPGTYEVIHQREWDLSGEVRRVVD